MVTADQKCFEAWRRRPGAETLRPLVERYLPFVHGAAIRRTGSAEQAADVARAVFLVLARRARRLGKKTVLAGWLFHVTGVASRKVVGKTKRNGLWRWFRRRSENELPANAPPWTRVAAELDAALDRLSTKQREAVLLRALLNVDEKSSAGIVRTSERRVGKRLDQGLRKLCRLLRKRGVVVEPGEVAQLCSAEARATPVPDGLVPEILALIDATLGRRPTLKLARRTLNTLAWARWRRRVAITVPSVVLLFVMLGGTAWYIDSLTGHSRLISMFLIWSAKQEGKTVPGLAQPARPWPADAASARLSAAGVRSAEDLYRTTNIWLAHLKLTREQWDAIQPKRIDPLPHFFQPDGTVLLRHPEAQRSGLAGVLGFDFHWTHADLEFGGISFANVAARIKGNGTYLGSLHSDKCAFKVDLNRFTKGQTLGGADELTFNNLVNDHSYLSDALAYEFFREAGVPASRTAYAYLSASVTGQWDHKPLGLYVMVEAVDGDFALRHFGTKRTPIFKPVTYELFKDLGDDWTNYQAIYDLKTKATAEQLARVMEFARLMTHAHDGEFARRVGEFLDLEKFARYLACEVLLSNYDSFLSNGQNFHLYLHPDSNKFGFIPWDLDLSWGGFFLLGTTRDRERASIWHPWVGQHRFLERVMAVEAFRRLYRAELEELLAGLFVPERLHRRIDALAAVVRSPIAAESDFRLGKFEQAVSAEPREPSTEKEEQGANRPAHQLKRFVEKRALSVRRQLDGKSDGVIMRRGGRR